jgi:Transposase IS66 family.
MEELFEKVDALNKTVKRLETENREKEEQLRRQDSQLSKMSSRIEEYETAAKKDAVVIQVLNEKVVSLTAENTLLKEEVSRLKSGRNNNSGNSSNPPSSDQKGVKKANEYNLRKKTTKKRGGQKGHKGITLTKKTAEELIASGKCQHSVKEHGDTKQGHYTTKYELDVSIEVTVIEHRIYEKAAGRMLPDSTVFYGSKLKSLVCTLYAVGVVSVKRIQEILSDLTDGIITLSAGAVYSFCRKLSERASASLTRIEEHILDSTVAYTDATVITVDGELAYIRNVSCQDAVRYYPMEKKSLEAMEKLYLLSKFAGVFVHDHETTLYHFGTGHGECNVHLLRYLLKNTEDCSTKWSGKMSELLYEMKKRRDELSERPGLRQLPETELDAFFNKYDAILEQGYKENLSTSPKWAKQDELALLNRLKKYKENHLLFLKDFDVAFSNNLSERDLRKCKNRQKIAGGFRNQDGAAMFADILSVVETAKRLNLNIFHSFLSLFHSPDPIFCFPMG